MSSALNGVNSLGFFIPCIDIICWSLIYKPIFLTPSTDQINLLVLEAENDVSRKCGMKIFVNISSLLWKTFLWRFWIILARKIYEENVNVKLTLHFGMYFSGYTRIIKTLKYE